MNYCFCVLGWHFLERFYRNLYKIPGEKFIVSHRAQADVVNRPVYELIEHDLTYCENRGLDWGGYHQFNAMGLHRAYDFVIYCHDDLSIKDPGFAQAVEDRFRDPAIQVIGNGGNGSDSEFRFGKYQDRMFFSDDPEFLVRTVRGSFFAAKTEVFSKIENFPVYWNTEKKLNKGNISLRNFGYLVTKHFGIQSITFLEPRSWRETRYLIEPRRGEEAA